MRVSIFLFVVVIAVGALAKARLPFEIDPLAWATQMYRNFPNGCIASSKDLLAYTDSSTDASETSIRRCNKEGGYDLVANLTQVSSPDIRSAHGKWIWIDTGGLLVVWKINENNQVSEQSIIQGTGGSMLSDDTFVTFDGPSGQFLTYQYQAMYNNWTLISSTQFETRVTVFKANNLQSYRAYDNSLVIADTQKFTIQIYQRQADKSWKFTDIIALSPDLGANSVGVIYNGVDTVVLSVDYLLSDDSQGAVYIYTKKDGVWNEQKFNTSSVGYVGRGFLGASCAFINQNTLLISACQADLLDRSPSKIGKVLMMTRTNGGDWTPHLDIVGKGAEVFGLAIAVNDYDLIVYEYTYLGTNAGQLRVYTAPLCFAQPIDVTCNNQQLNDCSSLTNTQLYKVNSSPSCGAVTPMLNGISLVNQKLQASFTFTRFEVDTFSCNATLTCSAKTSDGSMIQCFSLAVLSFYLIVF